MPDLARIVCDRAIAGELARARDIQGRFARPVFLVSIHLAKPCMSFALAVEIGEVQIVVTITEQSIQDWREDSGLMWAKVVRSDDI